MRGRLRLLFLFGLGLFLAGGVAEAATLTFPGATLVVPDDQDADPGDLVTYCFILTNNTPGTASFTVSFRSSPDWPLLGEATTLKIASGQEEIIPLTVMVPSDAAAGIEHHLELLIAWDAGPIRATAITKVKPRSSFNLTAPQPVTIGPGMTVDLPFVLGNLGNIEDTYHLEATSAKGWRLTPARAVLDLPANQVATAHFVLTVPTTISEGTTENITVTARSLKTGREQAATVRVRIGQSAADGFGKAGETSSQFRGEIGLAAAYPMESEDQPGVWLHLTGPVGAAERWELLLNGYFAEDPGVNLTLLQYQTEDLRIRLGHLASPWTGLVNPGTSQAGLDVLYNTGPTRLQLAIGTPDGIGLVAEPAWYGLVWTRSMPQLETTIRWLKTEGLNDSAAGYLDSSLTWCTTDQALAAGLAWEPGGDSSATMVRYWRQSGVLNWWVNASWADEINRPNQESQFSLGASYRLDTNRSLDLQLKQTQETAYISNDPAVPSEEASLSRQLRMTVKLSPGLTTYATVEEISLDDHGWAPEDRDYRLGFAYTRSLSATSSTLTLRSEYTRHEELTGGYGQTFLTAGGEYKFRLAKTRGDWVAGFYGYASADPSQSLPELSQIRLRLDHSLREKGLAYSYGFTYDASFTAAGVFSAKANLDWSFSPDTRLLTGGLLSIYGFNLNLQFIHRFGLAMSRPHATILGFVYQDLDGDNEPDANEPPLSGVWVSLDGRPVVRTGFDGQWTMVGVVPGAHSIGVKCDFDPSYRSKTEAIALQAAAGDSNRLNVPVWRLTRLTGRAFADREGDGIFNDGDYSLPDLLVTLQSPSGLEQTAALAEDGTFSFPDLIPGTYGLRVVDGLADELILPEPLAVMVAQQGLLTVDLPVGVKEKPVVMTFTATPQLTATVSPATAVRGATVLLNVRADMPLCRIEIQVDGLTPTTYPLDYVDYWSASVAIPAGQPLGPMTITIRAWDGGNTPGVTQVKVMVVKPAMSPHLEVTASPSTVAPGGIVTLTVKADIYLSRVEARLDGLDPVTGPANWLIRR